jgi:magnesium-transporting ATPase (P-type)
MKDTTMKPHPFVNLLLVVLSLVNSVFIFTLWGLTGFSGKTGHDLLQMEMRGQATVWITFILFIVAVVVFVWRDNRYTTRTILGLYGLQWATLIIAVANTN